jgi:hypothetical protein
VKDGRHARFRRIKGKPTKLKPKIVMKEVCGQRVAVKVYPAQYAADESEKLKKLGFKTGRIAPALND